MLFQSFNSGDSLNISEPFNSFNISLAQNYDSILPAPSEDALSKIYREIDRRATCIGYGFGVYLNSFFTESDKQPQNSKIELIKPSRNNSLLFQSPQNKISIGDNPSNCITLQAPDGEKRLFSIGETLGRGGNNVIKNAKDVETGEKVALKIENIPSQDLESEQEKARRKRDKSREMVALQHFGQLRGQGVIQAEDGREQSCLAVQLFEGIDLNRYLKDIQSKIQETRDPDQLKDYFKKLTKIALKFCKKVNHFHKQGFIHRDIKPSNVIITDSDGNLELDLIDFGGVVKIEEIDSDVDTDFGTKAYMAPELPHLKASSGTDAYSVGISLKEILNQLDSPSFIKIKKREKAYQESYDSLSQVVSSLTAKRAKRMTLPQAIKQLSSANKILSKTVAKAKQNHHQSLR